MPFWGPYTYKGCDRVSLHPGPTPPATSMHTIRSSILELLCTQTTGKVLWIWDRARWHTFEEVQEALDRIGRIQTLLLPARPWE
jgi:hypothetical protein